MATKAAQVESILAGFLDNSGNPLSGGKVYTYEAGTTTNKTTWQDKDKAATHANPIILDSQGQATVFADGLYKFVIRDSSDNLIETLDGIQYFFISSTITQATSIQAIDANGVSILDDGGNYGLIVDDGGNVGIGEDTNPQTQLGVAKQDSTAYSSTINITPTGSDVVRIRNTHSSAAWVGIQMEANSADPGIARLIVQKSGTDETDFHIQLKDADSPTNTVSQLSLTSEGDLTIGNSIIVGNATLSSGALESTVGNLSLNPVTGSAVVIDSHFSFDGTVLSALTDSNTTINAYAGRNITVESVTFDGGAVGGITTLAMTGALSGLTDISMSGTLDLGTNTILDGNFNGDWSFNSGNLSSVGTIGSGAITSTGVVQGTSITDGTATLSSGSLSGVVNITSSAGDIGITPVSGSAVILDSHFSFDGAVLTALTASDTTINAYTGQNITIESVTFDGGVVGGVTNLTMSGTLDIGTNTISDGNFNGNWSYNTGNLSSVGTIGSGAITSTGAVQGTSITDGSATLTSGSLSSVSNITMSGTLDLGTNTISDGNFNGNWSFNSGNLTSVGTIGSGAITSTGAVQGSSVTDGTGTLSSGGLSGITTISMSGNLSLTGSAKIATGGESSPDCANGGATFYSTATIGEYITLKNSNIAHGMTSIAEADTGAAFDVAPTTGGAIIYGYTESTIGVQLNGYVTTADTTTSDASGVTAGIVLNGFKKSGTSSTFFADSENVVSIKNGISHTTHIFKGNGDLWCRGGLTVDGDTLYVDASNDRVGIGTASPDVTLHSMGIIRIERSGPSLSLKDTDGSGRSYEVKSSGTTATDGILLKDATGGTDLVLFKRNGTVQFNTYGAGDLQTDASGNISAVSDAYLKDSVSEYRKGLEDLKRLRQVEYFWKEDTGFDQSRKYQGWLAQEVEKVLPEAVHGKVGDDGNYIDGTRSLQTRPILAATVNAVCELDERLSRLERVVD